MRIETWCGQSRINVSIILTAATLLFLCLKANRLLRMTVFLIPQ
jgi:hypothetical protein